MAVYWLISSALLADLYNKYCSDEDNSDCEKREKKFIILPLLGFVCMSAWVS